MRESMNRDGEVGEMRSMMISRVSVSMGRRLSLEVNMIDVGDTDILIGIGVVRGAEADQESTDEGELAQKLERRDLCSIKLSHASYDRMKSTLRLGGKDVPVCRAMFFDSIRFDLLATFRYG